MQNKLSWGLKAIAGGLKLTGVLFILMGMSLVAMGVPLHEIELPVAVVAAIILVCFGIWLFIISRWLAQLKKTGLNASVSTLWVMVFWFGVSGIMGLFKNEIGVVIFHIFLTIILIVCLLYLTSSKVKEQFRTVSI